MLKGGNNHAVMIYLNIMTNVFVLWHTFKKWFVGTVKQTLGYTPRGVLEMTLVIFKSYKKGGELLRVKITFELI